MSLVKGATLAVICSCCTRAISEEEWEHLELVGHFENDEGRFELRNCTCRSTISVPRPDALQTADQLLDALASYLVNGRELRREVTIRANRDRKLVLELRDFQGRERVFSQHEIRTLIERALVARAVGHTNREPEVANAAE
jgi:hypothetical protein